MSSDSDSDDDFVGPSILPIEVPQTEERLLEEGKTIHSDPTTDAPIHPPTESVIETPPTKKQKLSIPDYSILNKLYQNSYQNEATLTALSTTKDHSLVITGHSNGSIKVWRIAVSEVSNTHEEVEIPAQLECIKQFNGHTTKVVQLLVNNSGLMLCSIASNDKLIKIFDLKSLDMAQVIKLSFVPNTNSITSSTWFLIDKEDRILVGEHDSSNLFVVIPQDDEVKSIPSVHKSALQSAIYNYKYECFVTSDQRGVIEYWSLSNKPPPVEFKFKSETDLFLVAKRKSLISFARFSPDEEAFAVLSESHIRLFDFSTGKIIRELDNCNGTFAFDNKILAYTTPNGIEVLDLSSGASLLLGEEDQKCGVHFNQVLILNKLDLKGVDHHKISSTNSIVKAQLTKKLLVVCAAVNSTQLFIFGKAKLESRDINLTDARKKPKKMTFTSAVLHTSMGDITLKLFGNLVPKTVENFTALCNSNYYNNVIFHRVIKGFMIQTGDPKGDGTGGELCWGGHFKDEFNRLLTHSKPFMVSMANAGPNTNGSQFFITTGTATHLDNKHTVFGEVTNGFDTVRQIEQSEVEEDAPIEQVAILSTTLI